MLHVELQIVFVDVNIPPRRIQAVKQGPFLIRSVKSEGEIDPIIKEGAGRIIERDA
jgi:hypothetical protein